MKILMCALALFCATLGAQDVKPPVEPPVQPTPPDAEKKDEFPTSLGLQPDFNLYITRNYPEIDPAGEHDIFKLKNPTDPAKRHAYTLAMLKLITLYLRPPLLLGPTLSKLFDQYARGKEATQPVFKVLHAQLISNYPPGNPDNRVLASKMLLEAGKLAADYAYPWYILAEMELGAASVRGEAALSQAFKYADAALRIKPDFPAALALKADLLCAYTPPRKSEALALLAPMIAKPPSVVEDLDAVLVAYLGATGIAAGVLEIEKLVKRPDLGKAARARARQLGASALQQTDNFDEAIKWMEEALKEIAPESEGAAYVGGTRFIADCWGMKAFSLIKPDRTIATEDRPKFEQYVNEASKWHRNAVDLESRHLPLDMRGRQAGDYMLFMIRSWRYEEALLWVQTYLKETNMPALYRGILEMQELNLRLQLDPQEDLLIREFMQLAKSDEVEKLALALNAAEVNVRRKAQVYQSKEALDFFTAQLKSRHRLVVKNSATLAAHTALQRKTAESAEVAAAIATRLEEEKECVNTDQQELQEALCKALRDLKQWQPLARAVRHIRTFVDAQKGRLDNHLARVTVVFSNERFAELVVGAPEVLGVQDSKRAEKLSPWLDTVAGLLEKQPQDPPKAPDGTEKPKVPDGSEKPPENK